MVLPDAGTAGPSAPVKARDRQAPVDREGPLIQDVRAIPPVARPGEVVSLGARITDSSGVRSAWVRIQAPDVDLNVTLVASGDAWFLNRSWETRGGYGFEIGAQDGVGNLNTATGSFQVLDSLAGTFGLVILLGTLVAVGAGALAYLWIRYRTLGRR